MIMWEQVSCPEQQDHGDKTQVKELLEKIEEMCAGNENPYDEVDLSRVTELERSWRQEGQKDQEDNWETGES